MVSYSCLRLSRALLAVVLLSAPLALHADNKLTQPVAPVRPVTDTYFGTPVTDNYRWMEDLKSPEVQSWMKGQAAYTKDYLSKLPGRDALVKRIESLDNASTRVAGVALCGTRYFYQKLTPKDQTPKLYARDSLTGPERLLVDPQVLGGTGKRYTISEYYPSEDGKFVAVEIAPGGSEEGVVRVLDAATGKVLKDSIDRVWGAGVNWNADDTWFTYTRLQKIGPGMTELDKELNMTSYLHHLGDSADKDVPILGGKFNPPVPMVPTDGASVALTTGSPYAFGDISHGVKNEQTLLISPLDALAKGAPVWTKICDVDDDVVDAAVFGHDLWLLTHKDAPRFKVIHLDLDHPDINKADVAIPPSNLVLEHVHTAKDALYVEGQQGGLSHILRLPYGQATAKELPLPFEGSINGFSSSVLNDGAYLRFAGWTEAPQWYAYDPAADKITNTNLEPRNPVDFSGITSVEVTAPAADGTPVPLSIIYKKDLKLDGSNPCLMEGYGSYGISIPPNFDATRLALLEKGIVIAWAHVRGGGENGDDWHLAGQKLTKENTISDFIACAQYLIDKGYTSSGKLALRGTSAGGITIGGAITQRPDLFALGIVNVGVVNALRAESEPNGAVNTPSLAPSRIPMASRRSMPWTPISTSRTAPPTRPSCSSPAPTIPASIPSSSLR